MARFKELVSQVKQLGEDLDRMEFQQQPKYTLLELIDIAIRDEYSVVNFRYLHEIIRSLIKASGLADIRVPYDETTDQKRQERPYVHEKLEDNIDKWKHIKVEKRMEAFETDLEDKSRMIDELADMIYNLRKDFDSEKDFNKLRDARLEQLKKFTNELKEEQDLSKSAIDIIQVDLKENVAYKYELAEVQEQMEEDVNAKIKELKKLILEIESLSAKRDELMELVARTEHLEDEKVSREELGPLLDPGFLGSIRDLGIELNELKGMVNVMDTRLDELKYEVERENSAIKKNLEKIHSQLQEINSKLAQLDPEDINNAFADLEDANESLRNDLEDLKVQFDHLQREAKNVFNQIAGFSDDINRLQKLKIDKTECYALLKGKADLSLVMEKLSKKEFDSVVDIIKENLNAITEDLKRLNIQVKINEEEMVENFEKVRTELSLQMYKEDFILLTEPIKNRIKVLMIELKELEKIVRDRLDPDIPGTQKCICINSIAHVPRMKSSGDCRCNRKTADDSISETTEKFSKPDTGSGELTERFQVYREVYSRHPSTDLDSTTFPPADYPRERNLRMIPVLFAKAQPNIGLQFEKRKSVIKQELADFFSKKPTLAIDGAHTLTEPQQRGTSFRVAKVPLPKKSDILLQGIDKGVYRGILSKGISIPDTEKCVETKSSREKSQPLLPEINVKSLHSNGLPAKYPITSKKISFPSLNGIKETPSKK